MYSFSLVFRSVVLAMVGICFVPTSFAATYYINPSSGVDTNLGTSTGAAWLTLNKANGTLVAGDTVNLMTGSYTGTNQKIIPSNSGTSGSPITYMPNAGATVTFSSNSKYIVLDNKQYIVIQGPMAFQAPTDNWGDFTNADNITINGNTFTGANTSNYHGLYIGVGSSNNRITNNTFQDWGRTDGTLANAWGDAVRATSDSDRNLFEGNNFYNAGHSGLTVETAYNVVRGNYFKNAWWRGLVVYWVVNPSWDHAVSNLVSQFNIVEGNLFDSNGTQVTSTGGEGIEPIAPYTIYRRNVFVNNRTSGLRMGPWPTSGGFDSAPYTQGVRVYNNTFIHNGVTTGVNEPGGFILFNNNVTSVDVTNIHFKNNIFTRNTGSTNQFWISLTPTGTYGATYFNTNYRIAGSCFSAQPDLNITSLNGVQTLTFYQANYPTVFFGNDSATPSFVNESANDFHLQAGSGCIDRGVALTATTASAGSGTSVPVVDALYFSDGNGLVTGDQITIGSQVVNITAVNYGTNTLTIDRSISWASSAPIYYQTYTRTAPDAGAFEEVLPVAKIGHWQLNETSGTSAADISGNSFTGTLNGASFAGTGGIIDGALTLDGVNDYVSVPDNATLRFGAGDFSISVWVKFPIGGTVGNNGIVSKGFTTAAPANTWGLVRNSLATDKVVYYDATNAGGAFNAIIQSNALTDGWHHISVTRAGTVYVMYVDGAVQSDNNNPGVASTLSTTAALQIGNQNSNFLQGSVDDVHLYNNALSAAEVRALYDGVLQAEFMHPPQPFMRIR